ncbi:MAG: STAS domain-containing protein [Candidatus Omnitrophica bacterium]|nr:STAS domain-containing protein [Candidatus Omnitrophota bacterium]
MNDIFSIEKHGDVTIVNFLFSELSIEDAEDLKNALYAYISPGSTKFVVDLDKCSFFPSIALGVLASFGAKARSMNGRVVLARPIKEVASILDITKFGNIYDIYTTREEAISSFGKI